MANKYKNCPNCGKSNDVDVIFCEECGTNISNEPIKNIEVKIDTKICPNCKSIFNNDDLFCNKCGTKLEIKQPECHNCGAEYIKGKDLFCKKCGTNLETNEAFALKNPSMAVEYNKQTIHSNNSETVSIENNCNDNVFLCPYCKSEINKDVMKCPHCGEWIKNKKPFGCYGKISWFVFILSAIIASCVTQNIFAGIGIGILIVIGLWIYFIPSWIAELKKHRNAGAIFAVNLLLGETVIGWIIALIWALCG